jgi:hypothetical protein
VSLHCCRPAAAAAAAAVQVQYPAAVDDPSQLLFPALAHDPQGRLLVRVPDEALAAAISAAALRLPGSA